MGDKYLVLSEIGNCTPPVYIVTKESEAYDGCAKYTIDEHRCPSDTLGVEEVLTAGDIDPHGIISFVQRVPVPEDWPFTGPVNWDRYCKLFSALSDAPAGE